MVTYARTVRTVVRMKTVAGTMIVAPVMVAVIRFVGFTIIRLIVVAMVWLVAVWFIPVVRTIAKTGTSRSAMIAVTYVRMVTVVMIAIPYAWTIAVIMVSVTEIGTVVVAIVYTMVFIVVWTLIAETGTSGGATVIVWTCGIMSRSVIA